MRNMMAAGALSIQTPAFAKASAGECGEFYAIAFDAGRRPFFFLWGMGEVAAASIMQDKVVATGF
jgi:hypothetical protein